MEAISADVLTQSLNSPGNIITIEGKSITSSLIIDNSNYKCLGAIFENCEFLLNVLVEKIDLIFGIKFINCTFKAHLIFNNVQINKFDLEFNAENDCILIKQCKITNNIIFHTRNVIIRDTCIQNVECESIEIRNLYSDEGSLKIQDCTIRNHYQIGYNKIKNGFYFSKNVSKGSIRLENNIGSSYSFLNNNFESDVLVWYGHLTGGITFNDGNYKGAFKIQSVDAHSDLTIINAKFESEVLVEYESKNGDDILRFGCPRIYIRDSEFNNGLNVTGGLNVLDPYEIDMISINASKKLKGEVCIRGFEIADLKISDTNYDANIIFDNNRFTRILLERFTNFGTLQFVEARASIKENVSAEFYANNSHLGKTLFTNVSFERFKKIAIDNCNFTEIIASNVKWFNLDQLENPVASKKILWYQKLINSLKLLILNVPKLDTRLSFYRRKRELFRQLKHAMLQQGNRIQSLVFKQYEMKFFTDELRLTKNIFDKDRLIMEFSCTNSHGQNWIKPIIWLLSLTILFGFWLFIIFSPDLAVAFSFKAQDIKFTFTEFWSHKKIITQILNPTHSLSDIFGKDISFSGWLYGFDILYRVLYAFFVFQIIAAFRKFIK